MIYDTFTAHTRPTPVGAADRALIDRRISEHGITRIARGVSGETIEQCTASHVRRFNNYLGGANAAQVARRKAYIALADKGISRVEIAKILGVNRQSVSKSLLRMGVKIRGEVLRNG